MTENDTDNGGDPEASEPSTGAAPSISSGDVHEATVDQAEGLDQVALAQIEAFAQSEHAQDLFDVLSRIFAREIANTTWDTIARSVEPMFRGSEGMGFLAWLAHEDAQEWADDLSDMGFSDVGATFVLRVLTLFGVDIERAWDWSVLGRRDDWRGLRRDVRRDIETGDYSVSVRIHKRNGDWATVEGSPRSILSLARALVTTLNIVDEPLAFGRAGAEAFFKEADRLRGKLAGADGSELGAASPSEDKEPG